MIVIPHSAYPLQWPRHMTRTPSHERKEATFCNVKKNEFGQRIRYNRTNGDGISKIRDELRRLPGIRTVVISSNLPLRSDGLPYADGPQNPRGDVGVAVYWSRMIDATLVPYCMPCDRWDRIADNLYAVALSIEALRGMERWGCVSVEQAFAGFAALPPGQNGETRRPWRDVLGGSWPDDLPNDELLALAKSRHRKLITSNHPDAGGDEETAAIINAALDDATVELG